MVVHVELEVSDTTLGEICVLVISLEYNINRSLRDVRNWKPPYKLQFMMMSQGKPIEITKINVTAEYCDDGFLWISSLSAGVIAAIVFGVLLTIAIFVGIVLFVCRKRCRCYTCTAVSSC